MKPTIPSTFMKETENNFLLMQRQPHCLSNFFNILFRVSVFFMEMYREKFRTWVVEVWGET